MSRVIRGGIVVYAFILGLSFAAPVWAQQGGQAEVESMQSMQNEPTDPSYNLPYAWNVSFGVGTASGANPVGSVVDEEAEIISTFELDSGVLASGRVTRRIWWRLGAEAEFGYASPGVVLTETDLQGANVEAMPFADYSMGYFSVSARVDLVDARITPFLLGGVAAVFSKYADDETSTNPGFVFGGGLDVHIFKNFFLRGDVRGLRSDVDAPLLSRGLLETGVENRSALSTQVLWTIGAAVRF
jgi:opacity protein-like surface antigen